MKPNGDFTIEFAGPSWGRAAASRSIAYTP